MHLRTQPEWPWDKEDPVPCTGNNETNCYLKDAIDSYVKATTFCRQVLNYYESGGSISNNSKLAVGVIGALSGSVVSVVANGSAAKAWSGLSGATNGIQASMDQAFSAVLNANRMSQVRIAYQSNAKEIIGKSDASSAASYQNIVFSSVKMAADCAMGSANADAKLIQKLSDISEGGEKTEASGGGR